VTPFKVTLLALASLSVEGFLQLITQSGVPPLKLAALVLVAGALAVLKHLV